ncbi:LysM peptidoglycan-binding domain-containing protein [Neptunitalea lumnitzerae]|uniref:Lytic transglycosylase n=1 Tax=Neptunitalea lumnitzerae TaxID=2965509 RepID=A0ABQ5MGJ8_9FLAO|nr:LysM peptidoglycan-binding domain-containing protein [Neptunitalea sp. Y10]GLB48155.1 lytic transglycosylase [Neptunitalea sp. Y10]
MKVFCAFSMIFLSVAMYAQDADKRSESKADSIIILEKEAGMSVEIDTLDKKKTDFFPRINGKYNLEDIEIAYQLDTLWMKELYNSDLYNEMYADVTEGTLEEELEYKEINTDTLKARLAALNQRTPFNISYNQELERIINSFLKNRRESLTRLMSMSDYYFPIFEEKLDKYDLPLEIKYLAIVESAFNPKAKSRVGATGLWQFMYQTGKMYNLDVSSYVDERSDPMRSTEAASQFLARLYAIFGDWDLALAAYNSGPGNVTKAIRRSGGYQNYWNLRPYLPRETAGYVPLFLATMYVFEYAEEHGFKPKRTVFPYFQTDTIHVKNTISFDQISELTGIEMEEIQFFNPAYKLDIIPFIKDKNYTLRLPKDKIGLFVANEDSIYAYVKAEEAKREKPLPQFFNNDTKIVYRVRSGDVLGKIAQRYKVRVSSIKRWNGLRNNNIRIGQKLVIYPRSIPKKTASKTTKTKKQNTTNTANAKYHIVQEGDSLWSISKKYPGITIEQIKLWNDISSTNLKLGTKLKLCDC